MFKVMRDTRRLREIIFAFAKHGFTSWIEQTRLYDYFSATKKLFSKNTSVQYSQPEHFRMALEELGPTFVKLGQILSTRHDVLPEEWTKELAKLLDRVPPSEFGEVEKFLEEQLGKPVDEIFETFDKEPFAAASIAQVYSATLPGGKAVVVKVQRPEIAEVIEKDIEIIQYIAQMVQKSIPAAEGLNVTGVVDEFVRSIRREIDYTLEEKSMLRFRENFKDNPKVYIPQVYQQYTSRQCIVIEKIQGKRIDQVNGSASERREIAQIGARAILKQVFIDGIFHADPHPGNIFVLDGNIIAFIDFGMVGRIETDSREDLGNILIAAAGQDTQRLARLLIKLGNAPENIDERAFRADLADILDRYYGVALRNVQFGDALSDLLKITRKHQIHVPVEFTMMLKSLLTIEQMAVKLDREFNLAEEAKPFVEKLLLSKYGPKRSMEAVTRGLAELSEFMHEFPTQVRGILAKLHEGRMAFEFRHAGLDKAVDELNRASSRISFSLVILAIVIASSVMVTFSKERGDIFWLGLSGYFISGLLGLVLVIGTIRGGRL